MNKIQSIIESLPEHQLMSVVQDIHTQKETGILPSGAARDLMRRIVEETGIPYNDAFSVVQSEPLHIAAFKWVQAAQEKHRMIIQDCADAFWSVFAQGFPELKTGDSRISGEDCAALGLWLVGDAGDNPVVHPSDVMESVPDSVSDVRVLAVVHGGARSALKVWVDAGNAAPASEDLPIEIQQHLTYCVRHVLWANWPEEQQTQKQS